jgi:integrase/recombinase XerD
MRIGDAVRLTGDRLNGGKLLLYTQKTGVPVYCVLPDFVTAVLESTPMVTNANFFWTGIGDLDVIVGSWQKRMRRLFRLANVPSGHAHRFRDAFAAELLLAGVPIERVSILLGHRSRQAEEDLRRAWARDTIGLLESKVTPRLREESEAVN